MLIIRIISKTSLRQNSFLVVKNNTTILIDCGSPFYEIQKKYLSCVQTNEQLKIDAILLTHAHFDHICGLENVQSVCDCPVYILHGCKSHINTPKYNESKMIEQVITYKPKNLKTFKNGENLTIGNLQIKAFATPGHCQSCACFLIEDHLFSGDTLFYNSFGRTDLVGGNDKQMQNSLRLISSLNYTIGHPGHGLDFIKNV